MTISARMLLCGLAGFVLSAAHAQDPAVLAGPGVNWEEPLSFPPAPGRQATVHHGVEGKSGFNLHSYLARYQGRFWAIWSSAAVHEEDPDQQVVYSTSADGHNWSEAKVLAADPDGPQGPARWIARGLFLFNGKLTALAAYIESADYRLRGKQPVWRNLRLMYFQWEQGAWREKRVFADNCMNNFPPERLGRRLAMACRDLNMDVSMALLEDPRGLVWKHDPMASAPPFDRMDEPTWYQAPDGTLHMIVRDGNRSRKLIRILSRDGARSWEKPVLTNYPDATSKNFTGRLSNGWYFLISNPNPKGRDPLAISFSRDGWTFAHALALRTGTPGSYQYPHAIESGKSLWVIYSTNKRDIQLAELPLASLVPKK